MLLQIMIINHTTQVLAMKRCSKLQQRARVPVESSKASLFFHSRRLSSNESVPLFRTEQVRNQVQRCIYLTALRRIRNTCIGEMNGVPKAADGRAGRSPSGTSVRRSVILRSSVSERVGCTPELPLLYAGTRARTNAVSLLSVRRARNHLTARATAPCHSLKKCVT